mgnify:CR=1 FL=1
MKYYIPAIPVIVAIFFCGCISELAFRRADCVRYRYSDYNVFACDDRAVGERCARGSRDTVSAHVWHPVIADNGKPVDYLPRACFDRRSEVFGRKANLIIGKSFTGCIYHELCHKEFPSDPAHCEKEYPCLGDKDAVKN